MVDVAKKVFLRTRKDSIPALESLAELLQNAPDMQDALDCLDWILDKAEETSPAEFHALLANISAQRGQVVAVDGSLLH